MLLPCWPAQCVRKVSGRCQLCSSNHTKTEPGTVPEGLVDIGGSTGDTTTLKLHVFSTVVEWTRLVENDDIFEWHIPHVGT